MTQDSVSEELELMLKAYDAAVDKASEGVPAFGPRELDEWQRAGFIAALDALRPRLKAEGLREAAGIVRPLKLGQFIRHPVGAMAGAADLIEARADAIDPKETTP